LVQLSQKIVIDLDGPRVHGEPRLRKCFIIFPPPGPQGCGSSSPAVDSGNIFLFGIMSRMGLLTGIGSRLALLAFCSYIVLAESSELIPI